MAGARPAEEVEAGARDEGRGLPSVVGADLDVVLARRHQGDPHDAGDHERCTQGLAEELDGEVDLVEREVG